MAARSCGCSGGSSAGLHAAPALRRAPLARFHTQRLRVGVLLDSVVLSARVRVATPADKRAGKPQPAHMLEAFIQGNAAPFLSVGIYAAGTPGVPRCCCASRCCCGVSTLTHSVCAGVRAHEAELPAETEAAVRAAALQGLPGDAAQYARVSTDALPTQHGYAVASDATGDTPAEAAPPAAAPAAGASTRAATAAATAATAAAGSATRAAAAAAAAARASQVTVRNPLFLKVSHRGKARGCVHTHTRARVLAFALRFWSPH
jgi:hypothetical protein